MIFIILISILILILTVLLIKGAVQKNVFICILNSFLIAMNLVSLFLSVQKYQRANHKIEPTIENVNTGEARIDTVLTINGSDTVKTYMIKWNELNK